jgi:hypothetical protein
VTPAKLDAMLDEVRCPRCREFFRDCSCPSDSEIDAADVSEDVVAREVASTWLSRGTVSDTATGLRIWSQYRRSQVERWS